MSGAHEPTTELDDPARTRALEGDAYLVVSDGERLSAVAIPAGRALVVGRSESCDVVLHDAKASRQHARVERRGERLVLVDLGAGTGLGSGARPSAATAST